MLCRHIIDDGILSLVLLLLLLIFGQLAETHTHTLTHTRARANYKISKPNVRDRSHFIIHANKFATYCACSSIISYNRCFTIESLNWLRTFIFCIRQSVQNLVVTSIKRLKSYISIFTFATYQLTETITTEDHNEWFVKIWKEVDKS